MWLQTYRRKWTRIYTHTHTRISSHTEIHTQTHAHTSLTLPRKHIIIIKQWSPVNTTNQNVYPSQTSDICIIQTYFLRCFLLFEVTKNIFRSLLNSNLFDWQTNLKQRKNATTRTFSRQCFSIRYFLFKFIQLQQAMNRIFSIKNLLDGILGIQSFYSV